jgi:diadenosine tetraphosphate (Ap4A) HIT family hydrolase
MLLVVPKRHYTQEEFWSDALLSKAGRVAVEMGKKHCPEGFRVLGNFGWQAIQSQEHGHIHVVGGTWLGRYV